MNLLTRISNIGLKIALNYAFPLNGTPELIRARFKRLTVIPKEKLISKFPRSKIEQSVMAGVPVEIIETTPDFDRIILYLHGGGYFSGSPAEYRGFLFKLSYRTKAKIVAVDYRLAPEHPFPAALSDSIKVFEELISHSVDKPIILGGDSAGGGLTLATTLSLRGNGKTIPDALFCISPWTDLLGECPSMRANEKKDVWLSKRHVDAWAQWYCGSHDPKDSLISPIYGEYAQFPPMLILVGDQEVLFDESVKVFDKAKNAGVQVELLIGKEMQHDWLISLPWLKESKAAAKSLQQFIQRIEKV